MSVDDSDLAKLLSSSVLVLVGTILSSSAKLLERVVIGRLLSPEAYGEFSVALAVFTLGTTLGAGGYTQGIPRFMSRFDDLKDVRGTWLTGLMFTIGLSLLLTIGLVLGSHVVVPRLFESEEAAPLFLLFVASIPLYACFNVGVSAIRGQENTRYKILSQNITYPGLRLVLLTVLLMAGVGVIAAGLSYLLAILVTMLLTYVLLNRLFPIRGEFRLHSRKMTTFSAPLIISSIMGTLLTRTDTLMLGYFRPSSEVGIYNSAYPLAGVLTLFLGALGYMYLPVASRLDSDEDGSVEHVYEITTKWVYFLVFPLFAALLVYPNEIVSIVFGTEYEAGGAALRILAIGFFTNAAVGRNRETLSALGETNFILISNVIAFTINFFLNLLLIPVYGFMGAAVASASSYVLLNVVVYTFLRNRFGITPFNGRSVRAFIAIPVLLLPLGFLVGEVVPGSLLVVVSFTGVFAVLTVVIALLVRGFESDDIFLVKYVEDLLNVRIPIVRRYIPDE